MTLCSRYTVRIKKKGNPYSKAHCSKVNKIWKFACGIYVKSNSSSFIGTFLASGMSRMTEYIANEDDNVMTPLFASFRNWDGRLQWMLLLAIQMDGVPCYSHDTLKLHFESLGNHCKLSRFVLVWLVGLFSALSFYASTSSTYPPLISTHSWHRWSISWRSCLTIGQIDAQNIH